MRALQCRWGVSHRARRPNCVQAASLKRYRLGLKPATMCVSWLHSCAAVVVGTSLLLPSIWAGEYVWYTRMDEVTATYISMFVGYQVIQTPSPREWRAVAWAVWVARGCCTRPSSLAVAWVVRAGACGSHRRAASDLRHCGWLVRTLRAAQGSVTTDALALALAPCQLAALRLLGCLSDRLGGALPHRSTTSLA